MNLITSLFDMKLILGKFIQNIPTNTSPESMLQRHWTIDEALREVVQNAMDEVHKLPEVYIESDDVVIYDRGKGTHPINLVIEGKNAKSPCSRGKYGDGIKSAVAAVLLNKGKVEIYVHNPFTNKDIIILPHLTNLTLEGKTTEVMTYDIYESSKHLKNVGVAVHVYSPEHTPYIEFFRKYFIDTESYKMYDELITDDRLSTINISKRLNIIYSNNSNCENFEYKQLIFQDTDTELKRVYIKGIYVSNINVPSIWSYDLVDDSLLNIDRNGYNSEKLAEEVHNLIEKSGNKGIPLYTKLIQYCLDTPMEIIDSTLEFTYYDYVTPSNITPALFKIFGKKVLVIDTEKYDSQLYNSLIHKYKKIIDYMTYRKLYRFRYVIDQTYDLISVMDKDYMEKKSTVIVKPTKCQKVLLDYLEYVGGRLLPNTPFMSYELAILKAPHSKPVARVDQHTHTIYFSKDVVPSTQTYSSGKVAALVEILIHELTHITEGITIVTHTVEFYKAEVFMLTHYIDLLLDKAIIEPPKNCDEGMYER